MDVSPSQDTLPSTLSGGGGSPPRPFERGSPPSCREGRSNVPLSLPISLLSDPAIPFSLPLSASHPPPPKKHHPTVLRVFLFRWRSSSRVLVEHAEKEEETGKYDSHRKKRPRFSCYRFRILSSSLLSCVIHCERGAFLLPFSSFPHLRWSVKST